MGNISNIGVLIGGMVMVVVLGIVSFFLYVIIQQNADRYLAIFNDYCAIGETQFFTKVFLVDDNNDIATRALNLTVNNSTAALDAPTCKGIVDNQTMTITRDRITEAGTFTLVDQHSNPVDGIEVEVDAIASGKVTIDGAEAFTARAREPLPITEFLTDLSQIIIKLYPVLGVVGFLTMTGTTMVRIAQGGREAVGVTRIVVAIGAMILAVVAMNVSPTLIDGADTAYEWTDADRLPIMEGFGGIASLIIRFFPVVWSAGLLGLVGSGLVVGAMNYRDMGGRGMRM